MSRAVDVEKLKASLELLKAENRTLKSDMTNLKYKNSSFRASLESIDLNNLSKIQKDLEDKINDIQNLQMRAKLTIDYITTTIESMKPKLLDYKDKPSYQYSPDTIDQADSESIIAECKDTRTCIKENGNSIKKLVNNVNEEEEDIFIADTQECIL